VADFVLFYGNWKPLFNLLNDHVLKYVAVQLDHFLIDLGHCRGRPSHRYIGLTKLGLIDSECRFEGGITYIYRHVVLVFGYRNGVDEKVDVEDTSDDKEPGVTKVNKYFLHKFAQR
jgi:hypothetical protein